MRSYILLFLSLFFISNSLAAQSITFRILNKVITEASVEFDVALESNVDFKLGSGQVYINYNPAAFGPSVNNAVQRRVTVTRPYGSVLAQGDIFSIYSNFVVNDNTDSRFSFSWQQAFSEGYIPAPNITGAASVLFHVKMDFIPGGNSRPDGICFESGEVFDGQVFTACGPSTSSSPADCVFFPGARVQDDSFDCEAVALPTERSASGRFLSAFPNPVSEVLQVSFSEPAPGGRIRLFNELGQQVLQQVLKEGELTVQLQLGHLPKGAYWLEVQTEEGAWKENIAVQ